jgi:probable HAF family extracellular repeat protein
MNGLFASRLRPPSGRNRSRRRGRSGPRLEILEDRALPSQYTLTVLGTLGGALASAADINEAGQVVGYSSTADGQTHAFLWDDGVMTDLGTLGGPYSSAGALNDAGQVVGGSRVAAENFTTDAFVWENGVMTGLGILKQASAGGINDAGQVVGTYTRDPEPPSEASVSWAFLWDDGVFRNLFPGSGADINDAGQVAGPGKAPGATPWPPSGTPRSARGSLASSPAASSVPPLASTTWGRSSAGRRPGMATTPSCGTTAR